MSTSTLVYEYEVDVSYIDREGKRVSKTLTQWAYTVMDAVMQVSVAITGIDEAATGFKVVNIGPPRRLIDGAHASDAVAGAMAQLVEASKARLAEAAAKKTK